MKVKNVVEIAKSYVGKREDAGSNRSKWIDEINKVSA